MVSPPMRTAPEQIHFSASDPLASTLGLVILAFGSKTTATKRPFDAMKPWSLPFWSINWVARGGGWM